VGRPRAAGRRQRGSLNEKNLALSIARIALDKQARGIEIIDVSDKVDYADYVMVCSGRSERQARAIAEEIEVELKKKGVMPLGVEGAQQGRWILLDSGSVVVHVLQEDARDYYDIEGLWLDAERLPVQDVDAATGTE
jgi:ribosome-associated protein